MNSHKLLEQYIKETIDCNRYEEDLINEINWKSVGQKLALSAALIGGTFGAVKSHANPIHIPNAPAVQKIIDAMDTKKETIRLNKDEIIYLLKQIKKANESISRSKLSQKQKQEIQAKLGKIYDLIAEIGSLSSSTDGQEDNLDKLNNLVNDYLNYTAEIATNSQSTDTDNSKIEQYRKAAQRNIENSQGLKQATKDLRQGI